jgi:hypothetical protein
MTRRITTLAALALLAAPLGAQAATFADATFSGANGRADFLAAIGAAPTVTERFEGKADGTAIGGPGAATAFASGVRVEVDLPSADNTVEGDRLQLSLDNPVGPNLGAFTETVTLFLPRQTRFFGVDFGFAGPGGQLMSGIGNDNGSELIAPLTFDFNGLTPSGDDVPYVGFFGVTSDTAFDRIVLRGTGNNDFNNDDDFSVDNLIFAAGGTGPNISPVPVPAALPLLLGGMAALGLMGRRRRG